jgi:hypothetical protein
MGIANSEHKKGEFLNNRGQKLLPKNLPKDTDPAQFRILD